MMKMKVSVVTCTWNSAATLNDTIDSVQRQKGVDIEHIFVDGGSKDGTLDIISDRCPGAVVLRDVTGGISRAMNAGAAVATGELLAHLHSDDYYYADDSVLQASRLFAADPALQWAYGRIAVLRDGEVLPPQYHYSKFNLKRFLRGAASVPHPAVFIRRVAFAEAGGFSTELKYAMDIDLWLRLGSRFLPGQTAAVLAVFREHPGSLSTANVRAARQEEWRVRRQWSSRYPIEFGVYAFRYWRRRRLRAGASAGAG
jgi:glycosyltransferase involved in cell wall biosynthesis